MSVPPEMMAALRGAPAKPAAPPTPTPGGAPMATPQGKEGKKEAARVNIHIAMNMLEQALPVFGTESKEGMAILRTLSTLAKDFGKNDAGDLVPAEIMQMVKGMPQMGGGTEVQKALMAQMRPGMTGRAA